MKFSEPFWLKRTHTILLSGHGGALIMLCTALSDDSGTLNGIRDNIFIFVPFVFGLIALIWTGFRGITLDTYRTSIDIRSQLEDELKSAPLEGTKRDRILADIQFIESKIKDLNKKIKKRPWTSRFSLWVSGLMFILGIVMIGFGDKALTAFAELKDICACI